MTTSKNELQKAVDQIGIDAVVKAIPSGTRIGMCDMHGAYMVNSESELTCPICPAIPAPNGVTATEVELYIDIRDALQRYGV